MENNMLSSADIMLKTREVANLLNVHINTVRRWSNSGILQVYRVGPRRDRRYRKTDIDQFLSDGILDMDKQSHQ
jgi:excisionase family DNA binding protein